MNIARITNRVGSQHRYTTSKIGRKDLDKSGRLQARNLEPTKEEMAMEEDSSDSEDTGRKRKLDDVGDDDDDVKTPRGSSASSRLQSSGSNAMRDKVRSEN